MTNKERLEVIKPLLHDVEYSPLLFFVVRILQRRKDNPEMDLPEKQLKVYSFYSWAELEKNYHRIIEVCELNNARAYVRINYQNALDISHRMVKQIMDNIIEGNIRKNERVWDSITGKGGKTNYWVVDFDEEHMHLVDKFKQDLEEHYFERYIGKVDGIWTREWSREISPIVLNETKSGVHFLVKPFDTRIISNYNEQLVRENLPIIMIQKDANTILYIPTRQKDEL